MIHFIGKDNIVFHCIIFPAMLNAEGTYILPDNVPANEFLNLESDKISTSRNWAVWLHEYLVDFPGKQDVLRYSLCASAPETKDNDFTWKEFQARNNSELVAILGNFVNRTLVLTNNYYEGEVPLRGKTDENDETGVDEVHVVYTRFRSMMVQEPTAVRLLPLEVVEGTEAPEQGELLPLYEFEPSAGEVLDALLPKYVQSRVFFALLQAAASELAARQKAMKSATDNADELIKKYKRIANQARQAGITQETLSILRIPKEIYYPAHSQGYMVWANQKSSPVWGELSTWQWPIMLLAELCNSEAPQGN